MQQMLAHMRYKRRFSFGTKATPVHNPDSSMLRICSLALYLRKRTRFR